MKDKLDYISVDKYFWIQFNANFISFGLHGVQSNIHLTVSYNIENPDINLHLTKNVADPDNKPKIEIFRINKELLEETIKNRFELLLSNIFVQVDTKSQNEKPEYVSMDEIQEETERIIINSFTENDYKRKKRKLKIKADLETKFQQLSENPNFKEFYKTKRRPLDTSDKSLQSGFIMTSENSFAAIKIDDRWYKFRDEQNINGLLKGIVDSETVTRIKWRFKRALILLKISQTFQDTELENRKSIVLKKPS